MIITTIVGTFIQRLSIFVLTYIVYCGLGFRTAGMADVILLQAAIYVAVDMLPIPGAQGVTEAFCIAGRTSIKKCHERNL